MRTPWPPALPALLMALLAGSPSAGAEKTVGLPCEGCEAVFQGGPLGNWSTLPASARIAPAGEPGEALILEGTVKDASGKPAPGIVVYAYQTNAGGIYPRDNSLPPAAAAAARHGKLRGFARTDASGHYRFETIRPGGYPNTDIPQHIHMHVVEPATLRVLHRRRHLRRRSAPDAARTHPPPARPWRRRDRGPDPRGEAVHGRPARHRPGTGRPWLRGLRSVLRVLNVLKADPSE